MGGRVRSRFGGVHRELLLDHTRAVLLSDHGAEAVSSS